MVFKHALSEIKKRLENFPDTFPLTALPDILDVAHCTATRAARELHIQTKHTPDGFAVNKKAFWKQLCDYCREYDD